MNRCISFGCVVFLLITGAQGKSLDLRTSHDGRRYQVEVVLDGQSVLTPPPEGLWSIATDWKNGWPASWLHAKPLHIER
ncbi:MAG: hypothetical protein JSW59_13015, partial [Phycisphaerales bacterium]